MQLIHFPPIVWWFIAGFLFLVILLTLAETLLFPHREPRKYEYLKKRFLMTKHEIDCFQSLERKVGSNFYIFPQINFGTLLDHRVRNGQNWNGARRHIDEKSVDFVLCAKNDLSVVLAIELDDSTHNRPDRQQRDREEERIFSQAGLSLLRLPYDYDEDSLDLKINEAMGRQNSA